MLKYIHPIFIFFFAFLAAGNAAAQGTALPWLVYPVPGQTWYVCPLSAFTSITINARNANARFVYVRVKSRSTGEEFGSFDNTDNALVLANEAEATSDQKAALRIGYPRVTAGESYVFTIVIRDAQKKIIGQEQYEVTGGYPFAIQPIVLKPEANTPSSSVRPIITVGSYPVSDCDQAAIFYEIDTYPADWKGEDYLNATQLDTTWQVPVALKPATSYQVRVKYLFRSGIEGPAALHTFATPAGNAEAVGSSVSPNPFEANLFITPKAEYTRVQIKLLNQEGKVVFTKDSKGGLITRLEIDKLPPGLYVVEIRDSKGVREQFKVVKR